MCAWFNSDDAALVGTIMSIHATTNNGWYRMVLVGSAAPKELRANAASNNATQSNSTKTAWVVNTWHHAAAVFASTTSRTIYLDGVAGTTDTTSIAAATPGETGIGFYNPSTGNAQFMSGLIGEAAVWSASLDQGEITALAAGMSPRMVRPGALAAYWPLLGVFSPEIDVRASQGLTLTGTVLGAHNRVFMPKRRRNAWVSTPAAGTSAVLPFWNPPLRGNVQPMHGGMQG